ncbi:hypothetical protein JCM17960_16350 [Magnetospira thiophila]
MAAFDGGEISSDGGVLLLREAARRMSLFARLAGHNLRLIIVTSLFKPMSWAMRANLRLSGSTISNRRAEMAFYVCAIFIGVKKNRAPTWGARKERRM